MTSGVQNSCDKEKLIDRFIHLEGYDHYICLLLLEIESFFVCLNRNDLKTIKRPKVCQLLFILLPNSIEVTTPRTVVNVILIIVSALARRRERTSNVVRAFFLHHVL